MINLKSTFYGILKVASIIIADRCADPFDRYRVIALVVV